MYRILFFAAVIGLVLWGLRSILRDWRDRFMQDDAARLKRDRAEAKRPDIISLRKDQDGVYRPGDGE
jgi:hypothetical protein